LGVSGGVGFRYIRKLNLAKHSELFRRIASTPNRLRSLTQATQVKPHTVYFFSLKLVMDFFMIHQAHWISSAVIALNLPAEAIQAIKGQKAQTLRYR